MPLLVPEVCVPTSSNRPPPGPFANANPPRPATESAAEPKINPRLLISLNLFSSFHLIHNSAICRRADKLFPTARPATAARKESLHVSQSSNASRNSPIEALRGRLIVSCQASEGDPLDNLATLTRIATSVLRGGAGGLRAEGVPRITAFRAITQLPIIGLIKSYDANGDVYITPDFHSAKAISNAGADIIALDCTARRLTASEPWPKLIHRIHTELNRPVLADIATF